MYKINFSSIDRLYYIFSEEAQDDIHHQQTLPTAQEIREAIEADNWKDRFADMRAGKEVRVSSRIYYAMLGGVPPKKSTGTSFFAGECYTDNHYYYFEIRNNLYYGSLRDINTHDPLNQAQIEYINHLLQPIQNFNYANSK